MLLQTSAKKIDLNNYEIISAAPLRLLPNS